MLDKKNHEKVKSFFFSISPKAFRVSMKLARKNLNQAKRRIVNNKPFKANRKF